MKVEKYPVHTLLKSFVKTMLIIESDDGMQNRLLPDTSIVMAFRFKGIATSIEDHAENLLPLSVISGLRRSAKVVKYNKNTSNLLVIFHEAGIPAFMKEPAHELFDQSISLDTLFPKQEVNELEEKLGEAKTNIERFKIAERFLLMKLKYRAEDKLVLKAVETIRLAKGHVSIKDLTQSLFISQDPFEKRFRKITGTTPKHFASIIRLRNLIDTYSPAQSFTDIAYTAGYFDQAHFIKNFKSFTGQTPQLFFQSGRYW